MTEAASSAALSEVSRALDVSEESLEGLKAFSRLLEESERFSHLLGKTEKYRKMVPDYILEQVQEDYRKKKEEIDAKLEAQKEDFRRAYQEHLSEKEVLEQICARLRDRLKEIRFRMVVGEYEEEDVREESRDLRRQLAENMERLEKMEEILDQYIVIDADGLTGESSPEPAEPPPAPEREEGVEAAAQAPAEQEPFPPPRQEEDISREGAWGEAAEAAEAEPAPVQESQEEAPPPAESTYTQGYLTILDGSRKGDRVPLIPTDITLGNSPNTDVMLTDQGIAETHARIFYRDRKYFLENMDVLGRTYVNGIQAKVTELNHNDVVRLGSLNLRVDFSPVSA